MIYVEVYETPDSSSIIHSRVLSTRWKFLIIKKKKKKKINILRALPAILCFTFIRACNFSMRIIVFFSTHWHGYDIPPPLNATIIPRYASCTLTDENRTKNRTWSFIRTRAGGRAGKRKEWFWRKVSRRRRDEMEYRGVRYTRSVIKGFSEIFPPGGVATDIIFQKTFGVNKHPRGVQRHQINIYNERQQKIKGESPKREDRTRTLMLFLDFSRFRI